MAKPHLAKTAFGQKNQNLASRFRDRIWPNRIWPELVFQSFDRIWPNRIWPELVFLVFWPKFLVLLLMLLLCCCCLCVCCVLCVQDFWWVSSRFSLPHRPLPRTAPPLDGPSAGRPKISLFFFFSPAGNFILSSLSGGSSRGILVVGAVKVWSSRAVA